VDYKELLHITINNNRISKEEIQEMVITSDSHLDDVFLFLKSWFDESKELQIQSSGSTGNPKLISIPKQSFIESAKNTCDFLSLNSDTNALLCIPVKYIGGKMMVIRALYSSYNLFVDAPSSNPLNGINNDVDFIALTPMQAQISLTKFPKKLEGIKNVIIGGGSVSVSFTEKINSFQNAIYSTYGMTETLSHIALRKLSANSKSNYFEVFPSYSISINKDDCLVIDCPTLSKKKIETNDIVKLNGNKFIFIGRKDNVINTGGIKVNPEEIEKKLSPFLNKIPFYITSLKDEILGEKVVLVTENRSIKLDKLKDTNHGLDSYSFPKEIINEIISLTETGKIIRKKY